MLAEPAGKELIYTSGSGRIATATASWPRPGALCSHRFRRSGDDRRDHAAVLGYLQDIPVFYP
jgi:hypothetical protein